MAKQTRLGTLISPRNHPTFSSADWADYWTKAAAIGSHVSFMLGWGDRERASVAMCATLQAQAAGKGLAFDIAIGVTRLDGNRKDPWIPGGTSFTDPVVREAYKAVLVEYASLRPRRLDIATEINLLAANPREYAAFVTLAKEGYDAIKAAYPSQLVGISFQWDRMLIDRNFQSLYDFLPASDLTLLTSYPSMIFTEVEDMPPNWYTSFRTLAGLETRRFGISEIGWHARPDPNPTIQMNNENRQHKFFQNLPGAAWLGSAFSDKECVTVATLHDLQYYRSNLDFVGLRYRTGVQKRAYTVISASTYQV